MHVPELRISLNMWDQCKKVWVRAYFFGHLVTASSANPVDQEGRPLAKLPEASEELEKDIQRAMSKFVARGGQDVLLQVGRVLQVSK